MKRILISGIFIGLFITLGSIAAILYATGYRISFDGATDGKIIAGTGLLVATSRPDGARVLIDNDLATATNSTINLKPGEYDVRIEKDGYLPWSKKIIIKNGLVSEANAFLLPAAPKLEAVTTIGVSNVTMDQSGSLLAYSVATASAARNGIYVLDMNARSLIFLAATGVQIVDDSQDAFSQAEELSFSPDGKELLVRLPNNSYYLLTVGSNNRNPRDVTNILAQVTQDFERQKIELDKKVLDSLPGDLRTVAQAHFKNVIPSPEGDRLLYEASVSANLPRVLKTQVHSVNSTPDRRNIIQGSTYVYDIREDKNYLISARPNKYLWHPGGRHIIFAKDGKINIVEYDGGNLTAVYNGPFLDNLVFPWPNGASVAIVSRLSPSVPYNIYRVYLR
jgi:WD40 repeat protein